MKRIALSLVVTLAMSACAGSDGPPADADTPGMFAAAVEELITRNHTFGEGPPPFTEYLIISSFDPNAGDPVADDRTGIRPLTAEERAAIEAVVVPFGTVRWIDDASDWWTDDLEPVVEGSVIIGVGEPRIGDETALVPMSLWCGGLCGTWLSYRINLTEVGWVVEGTEGTIAIS